MRLNMEMLTGRIDAIRVALSRLREGIKRKILIKKNEELCNYRH